MATQKLPANLIIGTDLEGDADHAVHAGLSLAQRFGSEVEVVHAVDFPPAVWMSIDAATLASIQGEAVAAAAERVRARLREVEERLGLGTGAVAEHLQVLPGTAAQVLIQRAAERAADLLVLGAHHRHGLFDFGSTARAVLSHAPCPVWVQPGEVEPIRRILAPVDLSEPSLDALAMACRLAAELEAEVEALFCYPPAGQHYTAGAQVELGWPGYSVERLRDDVRAEFERVLDQFDWGGVSHTSTFVEGHPPDRIREREAECDLVVMGTHGRTGLARFLLGSVAYAVLKHARKPVLALRDAGGE